MSRSFHYPQVDLNNVTAIAEWYTTHHIPQRYNGAIVFASVFVAILGAHSTLVILGKRTGNTGTRNALLLIWAAMTMSCVGIWGMHFIGMNFRLEPVPGVSWYVAFSPGFTVFSLIVPFIALVLAFVFVDYFTLRIWRIAVSGIMTGCIVGLMHYSASMKCNFNVSYAPAQTVISILLACVCAIIALTLFFRLRAQWQDSWQRRLLCSIILAVGVSGMHYTGSSGTSYKMKPEQIHNLSKLDSSRHGNVTVVIIVAVMCFVIFVASTFISVADALHAKETRKRARKIVLASASFDHLGRLLVHADGSLPLVTLEEKTLRHSEVLQALNSRSEIFQWLFSISWAWNIVVPFLDSISKRVGQSQSGSSAAHDHATCKEGVRCNHAWHIRLARELHIDVASRRERKKEKRAKMAALAANATSFNAGVAHNSRSIALLDFRDRVVDAARRLSEQLEVSLEEVGVFYDRILPTGTQKNQGPRASLARRQQRLNVSRDKRKGNFVFSSSDVNVEEDEEESISASRVPSIFADGDEDEEGVSMFLVREMTPSQQLAFAKKGYRFTETRFLATVLADRHGVGKTKMEELLDGLRLYAKRGTRPVVQPGGVYAGLFGVRPSMAACNGGLDVLVYGFAHHQIPAFRLPDVLKMTSEMRTFLRLLDQMPVDQALRICERESIRTAERNKAIARLLLDQAQQAQLQGRAQSNESAERTSSNSHDRSNSIAGSNVLGDISHNSTSDDHLKHVMDLQSQEVSLQAFQIALYTALEALMQSVRVFPKLMSTARISADVLEVPSSLDDAKPPAHVILVQAVLPIDKSSSGNARSSASVLSGLVGQTSSFGIDSAAAERSTNSAQIKSGSSLVIPTENAQAGTPFVFTPYTLFNKMQMMLLRGRTAQAFSLEVQQALSDRYDITLAELEYFKAQKGKEFNETKLDRQFDGDITADDRMSEHTSFDKSRQDDLDDEKQGEGDNITLDGDSEEKSQSKHWMPQLNMFGKSIRRQSKPTSDRKQSIPTNERSNTEMTMKNEEIQIHVAPPPPSSDLIKSSSVAALASAPQYQGASLGIRRFTGDNMVAKSPEIDQSKFARPAEEIEPSSNSVTFSQPSYPPSASRSHKINNGTSNRRSSRSDSTPIAPPPRRMSSIESPEKFDQGTMQDAPLTLQGSPVKRARSKTVGSSRPPSAASKALRRLSSSQIIIVDEGISSCPDDSILRPSKQSLDGGEEGNNYEVGGSLSSRLPFVNALGLPRRPQTSPTTNTRPASANDMGRTGSVHGSVKSSTGSADPTNANNPPNSSTMAVNEIDSIQARQARQKLDNWQLRQLRDLERFQPNLLLGVLPSEY